MNVILASIKDAIGVVGDNLGFDHQLLMQINSAAAELAQIGVDEFADLTIGASTEWPAIESSVLLNLVKQYIYLRTRTVFDASASSTIAATLEKTSAVVEGRIAHEVEHIDYLAGLIP